ncbi:hypothetical protein UVI_02028340 [Ustilaginoidea virens]|uniref:Expansin-like EG45 domain-containing protein n=1 Tax=Ustilaginoidea virens TaxID=1159556 RepID=A0A1B5KUX6_USTVR|nr:hypothetical protein UVI_02028340 [Ustilaginoidea virens]
MVSFQLPVLGLVLVMALAPLGLAGVRPARNAHSPPDHHKSNLPSPKFVGLGTRYGAHCREEDCWQTGACSFVNYTLPATVEGSTCVSEDIWNNGGHCGGCISVSYQGRTITVMVTNLTGGKSTHLDMAPATWAKLTNGYHGGGADGIEWRWVRCPLDESVPLAIHMHAGSSKQWFAATVENATLRTASLDVSADGGKTWRRAVREMFNMYVLRDALPDDVDRAWVRVTSISGSQVTVPDVVVDGGHITQAAANY